MVEVSVRRQLGIREFPYLQTPIVGRVVLELLENSLQADPPQLIHVQTRNAAPQGMWLARNLQRPYLLTVHDYMQPRQTLRVDRHWCQQIIAVSESVKADLLARTGLPDSLVTVIHSGVDCDVPPEITEILPPGRVPVIGTAGPLEAVKGFPFFLGQLLGCLPRGGMSNL